MDNSHIQNDPNNHRPSNSECDTFPTPTNLRTISTPSADSFQITSTQQINSGEIHEHQILRKPTPTKMTPGRVLSSLSIRRKYKVPISLHGIRLKQGIFTRKIRMRGKRIGQSSLPFSLKRKFEETNPKFKSRVTFENGNNDDSTNHSNQPVGVILEQNQEFSFGNRTWNNTLQIIPGLWSYQDGVAYYQPNPAPTYRNDSKFHLVQNLDPGVELLRVGGEILRVEDFQTIFLDEWWTSTALLITLECPNLIHSDGDNNLSYHVFNTHETILILTAKSLAKYSQFVSQGGGSLIWDKAARKVPKYLFFPLILSNNHYYCVKADTETREIFIFDPYQHGNKVEKSPGERPKSILEQGALRRNQIDIHLLRTKDYIELMLQEQGRWCQTQENFPYGQHFETSEAVPVQTDGFSCAPLVVLYVCATIGFPLVPEALISRCKNYNTLDSRYAMAEIRELMADLIWDVRMENMNTGSPHSPSQHQDQTVPE